jgi:hypothetical protein
MLLAHGLTTGQGILRPDHRWSSVPYLILGGLSRRQGRFPEADEHLREALRLTEEGLRPDHPKLVKSC